MPRSSCFVRGAEPCVIMLGMLTMLNIMLAMLIVMLILFIIVPIMLTSKLLMMICNVPL